MSSGQKLSKTHWKIRPAVMQAAELARGLGTSPILAQVLVNRGISTVEEAKVFLNPKLTDLIEPERMPGVETAVRRVVQALRQEEPICVYGDYDVDGITGVSILWYLLTLLGGKIDYDIPHRIHSGNLACPDDSTMV